MPETEKTTVTETAPSETVKLEEKESEAVVSESDEKAAAYVAPIANVTSEDKEAEAKVEKNWAKNKIFMQKIVVLMMKLKGVASKSS